MLDCLDDLESDFSVFHRIDDMYSLSAPEFLKKANRIMCYSGAVRVWFRMQAKNEDVEPVAEMAPAVAGDPDLFGLVEFG